MNEADVSVCIPCYNHGLFLQDAIESALSQTCKPREVLVVDDGSTDTTREVARSYGERIECFHVEHGGLSKARNFALSKVKGRYCLNLDADNILAPEYIEKTLPVLLHTKDPKVVFVYTQREYFGDLEGTSRFPKFSPEKLKFNNYIDACSLIRTDIAKEIGHDPDFDMGCEDWDFFFSVVGKGYRGILKDEPLYKYRVHGKTITGGVKRKYLQREIYKKMLKKHKAFFSENDCRAALRIADQKIQHSVLMNRSLESSMNIRLQDLFELLRAHAPLDLLLSQIRYTIRPDPVHIHRSG